MSKPKLIPCPFCGQVKALEIAGRYSIVCNSKKGGCGATSGSYRTEKELIENWNKRAGLPESCDMICSMQQKYNGYCDKCPLHDDENPDDCYGKFERLIFGI